MSETSDRLLKIIKEKDVSYGELAQATGIPKSALQRYATGETKKIPLERVESIARALGVGAASILGWDDGTLLPSNLEPLGEMKKIPLIGTIACGTPILAVENIEEFVDLPRHIRADYALTCKGDSMIGADINDGDIVYIREQPQVEPGQIAAVLIDDEATLKRFYQDGEHVYLMAENPKFPPLVYTGEEINQIRIIGLAVAHTRRLV